MRLYLYSHPPTVYFGLDNLFILPGVGAACYVGSVRPGLQVGGHQGWGKFGADGIGAV